MAPREITARLYELADILHHAASDSEELRHLRIEHAELKRKYAKLLDDSVNAADTNSAAVLATAIHGATSAASLKSKGEAMYNALLVILRDPQLGFMLRENDAKAIEQAERAVLGWEVIRGDAPQNP